MYIRTEHILDHPFCKCYYSGDFEGYSWGIRIDNESKPILVLNCPACKSQLKISNEAFKASIIIRKEDQELKSYNKAQYKQADEEKNKVTLKVLEFPKPDNSESK